MQPLRLDQLVVDQQYYIRDMRAFQGPWGTVQGLNPFTFDGRDEFHLTNDPALDFIAFNNGDWLYFPVAGGVPVPPPVVAPAPLPPLPDGGHLVVSDNAKNAISYDDIAEGDELVNWNMNADLQGKRESNFGYYYKTNTYNKLPNPKISPTTRANISAKNPRRYTALLPAFPSGSANAGLFNRSRSMRMRKRKGKSQKKQKGGGLFTRNTSKVNAQIDKENNLLDGKLNTILDNTKDSLDAFFKHLNDSNLAPIKTPYSALKNANQNTLNLKNRRRYHNYLEALEKKLITESLPSITALMKKIPSTKQNKQEIYQQTIKNIKDYKNNLLYTAQNYNDYSFFSYGSGAGKTDKLLELNETIKRIDLELKAEESIPLPDYGGAKKEYSEIFGFY
jgi:hypothetical protein